MIKATVRGAITRGIVAMLGASPSIRAKVIQSVVERWPERRTISHVLALLPLETIKVRGAQGVFEGSAQDVSVIQKYAIDGEWSPRTLERVTRVFAASGTGTGTYVDIGANIGLTAIPVAMRGIHVIAFEPTPANFALLGRNAAQNAPDARIDLHQSALLDKPGEVTFELSPANHGDHRLRRNTAIDRMGENQWDTVTVSARTLDSYLPDMARPLVLKIDTQGSEPLVFAGGQQVLAEADMVIAEFSPYAMTRMQTDPSEMIAYFAGLPTVEVYEREDESNPRVLHGQELAELLTAFNKANRDAPIGAYLNLVGIRTPQ